MLPLRSASRWPSAVAVSNSAVSAAERSCSPASNKVTVPTLDVPSTSVGNCAATGDTGFNNPSASAADATELTSMVMDSTLSTPNTRASAPPSAYTCVSGTRSSPPPAVESDETGTDTMLPPSWSPALSTKMAMLVSTSSESTVASMPTGVMGNVLDSTLTLVAPSYRFSALTPARPKPPSATTASRLTVSITAVRFLRTLASALMRCPRTAPASG